MATPMAGPMVQDMPPPGGYPKIKIARHTPPRGPHGAILWAAFVGVVSYGFYGIGQTNIARRGEKVEKRHARMQLMPLLQAEHDVEFVREERLMKRAAEDVMATSKHQQEWASIKDKPIYNRKGFVFPEYTVKFLQASGFYYGQDKPWAGLFMYPQWCDADAPYKSAKDPEAATRLKTRKIPSFLNPVVHTYRSLTGWGPNTSVKMSPPPEGWTLPEGWAPPKSWSPEDWPEGWPLPVGGWPKAA
ncbi:unnamed protein product [Chrysoparadoxa australica]